MANEIKVTIGADTKDADRAVKSFREKLDNVAGKARGAGMALSAMGAVGTVAITNFAQAAITQQVAVDSLAAVVTNAGENFADMEEKVMATTAALQRKTNYGDEAQIRVLTQLVPMLGNTEDALAALPAIMEVAAVTNKDFESTVATLGPVLAGMTNKVRGTSLEFDNSQGPMERVNAILAELGGTAEAQANPFTQMGNAIGDVKESLGAQLLPIITPVINKIQEFAEKLQNVNPTFIKVAALVLAIATAVGVIGGPILLLIGMLPMLAAGFALVSAAAFPITAIIVGIAAAVAAGVLIWKNWDKITSFVSRSVETLVGWFQSLWDIVMKVIEKVKVFWQMFTESGMGKVLSTLVGFSPVGLVGKLLGFQSGGRVPGPEGAPRLGIVHGGEVILNRSQQAGGFGGVTVNITGNNITGELAMDRLVRRALASAGVRGAF
jgi:hypothetical protein